MKKVLSVYTVFNDEYLSIPERPGSLEYLFHEIPGITVLSKVWLNVQLEISRKTSMAIYLFIGWSDLLPIIIF